MRKLVSLLLLPMFLFGSISQSALYAVSTNGLASPWDRAKAEHLARSVLFYTGSGTIDTLAQAGSASAAVNLLFPDANGPDRTAFNTFISTYTSSGFSWTGSNDMTRLYQLTYATDPYEAKRKLFSLFEDIYSVNTDTDRDITTRDIYDQQSLIYANMLGNYEDMIKKLLYNNGGLGDYAEGDFLDLFNQTTPNNPNENYARELLQLFLMGEYEPFKSKDNNDIRNYEETDVKALARILTGLRANKATRALSFDINTHYSGATLVFLSGAANTTLPAYYDTASGTVNPTLILTPNAGNNGLTDNVIEYIFAKRSQQIALFLADRLYRFYVADAPTRPELDTVAQMIVANNFDMLASVKQLLSSDLMYSDKSMNTPRYKNPLELTIGTIKLLQNNTLSKITTDPNIYDTNLLRRLEWTPYYPGSVFGRDGFDNSNKWVSTSIENTWMSATNYFSYRNGTGAVDFRALLGNYRMGLTNEVIPVLTSSKNNFTGSLIIIGGSLDSNPPVQVTLQALASIGGTDTGSTNSGAIDSGSGTTGSGGITDSGSTNSGSTNTGSTDSGSTNTGSTNTGSTDTTGSGSTGSGSTDTGSGSTGSTGSGGTDTNSGSTNSGSTNSGSTDSGSVLVSFTATGGTDSGATLIGAAVFTNGVTSVSSGYISLPNFQAITDAGILTISGGTYDAGTKTITISSGSLNDSGTITPIYSGTLILGPSSTLAADTLTADNLIDIFSSYLLGDVTLPSDVRAMIRTFLTTDDLGNPILVTPGTTEYYDKKIRGLVSIILSQPEYVLLHGYDISTATDTNTQHLLDSETSKLIVIELGGGNDYLENVIPKDEYATYVSYRTSSSGSIALSGSDLADLGGNYYMNSALAYGTGTVGFKSLYDEGSLKIFNRVGTTNHSQDHDAAAKQMTSLDNVTTASALGLFGNMVANEYDGTHTDSLGSKFPNIFRGGHYVNLGGNIVLTNPMNGNIKYHMSALEDIVQTRTYPGNVGNIFRDAGKISDIAKTSVAQGGPSGANGDMNNVFRFTKILMDNNIGRTYYMAGYGGYDVHGGEYPTMKQNLSFVGNAVTNFFNSVKGTQDVTIVIFSEFGRTNKMNGGLGTDHGIGGGMYVITSNPTLKTMLPNSIYGNLSFKDAKSNGLGVSIDYRSVYEKIFNAIYGIDGQSYFHTSINLEDDTSTDANEMSLLSYTYQASGNNIIMNGEFSMTGRNYNPTKAGYTRVLSGTGVNAYRSSILSDKTSSQGYGYTFRLNSSSQPYFQIDSFSNQYTLTSVAGALTGATAPRILGGSVRAVSRTGSSILPVFNNTSAPRVFVGTGVILESTGSSVITPSANPDFAIHFASGLTQVTELTSSSGTLTWNGGFLLGENVDKNTFIPRNAVITNSGITLTKSQVTRLVKIGADKLGVGMLLNQPVQVEFRNITDTGSYRVLTSEDGVNWSDVEGSGQTYQRNASGSIIVSTNHFSYFALAGAAAVVTELPPTCTMNISPTTATNGTPVALSWNLVNVATGTLNPGNSTLNSASGSINIIPPASSLTTYTIQVSNTAGNSSCNASVLMTAPTNTGSTNTGSTNTGSTNTGTTNTGTVNTGTTTPTSGAIGPGGGGGGSSSMMTPTVLLPNRTSTPTTTETTGMDPTVEEVLVQNQNLTEDYLVPLELRNDNLFTEVDKQKALQTGLKIWRNIAKYPSKKEAILGETITSLHDRMGITEKENAKEAIAEILSFLQGYESRASQPAVSSQSEDAEVQTEKLGVQYVGAEHALTLRSDMVVAKNTIITYLARNEAVQVLANFGKWSKVAYNGIEGYVKNTYLRDEKLADRIRSGELPPSSGQQGIVQVDHSAYIRTSAGMTDVVGVVHNNDILTILDEMSGWLEIIWNGLHGYIAKWLINI